MCMNVINLAGEWTLRQKKSKDTVLSTVPGQVHLDLLAAKKIENPFYRDNENHLQWIGETDWEYSRQFELSPEFIKLKKSDFKM